MNNPPLQSNIAEAGTVSDIVRVRGGSQMLKQPRLVDLGMGDAKQLHRQWHLPPVCRKVCLTSHQRGMLSKPSVLSLLANMSSRALPSLGSLLKGSTPAQVLLLAALWYDSSLISLAYRHLILLRLGVAAQTATLSTLSSMLASTWPQMSPTPTRGEPLWTVLSIHS